MFDEVFCDLDKCPWNQVSWIWLIFLKVAKSSRKLVKSSGLYHSGSHIESLGFSTEDLISKIWASALAQAIGVAQVVAQAICLHLFRAR